MVFWALVFDKPAGTSSYARSSSRTDFCKIRDNVRLSAVHDFDYSDVAGLCRIFLQISLIGGSVLSWSSQNNSFVMKTVYQMCNITSKALPGGHKMAARRSVAFRATVSKPLSLVTTLRWPVYWSGSWVKVNRNPKRRNAASYQWIVNIMLMKCLPLHFVQHWEYRQLAPFPREFFFWPWGESCPTPMPMSTVWRS